MQVSKHPAFQMILRHAFSRGLPFVAGGAQGLQISLCVGLQEAGVLLYGFDMVNMRV